MGLRWLAVAALMFAGVVSGKSLYVNNSGSPACSDATTYAANTAAAPWCTIGRAAWGNANRATPNAAQAAAAGDTVYITAGTYTTAGQNQRFNVAYNPANDGTSGSPIRFEAVGTVVLTFSSGVGPMIGSNSRDYIQWSGFTISESSAPSTSDTGQVTFFDMVGGSIENSTLTGNPNWTARVGDNYPAVRLEDAPGVRVYNNTIKDYGFTAGDRNHGGVETYRSFPVTIENNHFENCATGVYMKAVHTGTLFVDTVRIRFNRFVGNKWGINVLRMPMTETTPMLIYQNIFSGAGEAGAWINVFDNGTTDPTWIRVFNNTFAMSSGTDGFATYNHATFKANSNFLFWNNIVYGGYRSLRMDTSNVSTNSTKDRQDYDRNVYYGWSSAFGNLGGSNYTMAAWQAVNTQDANSISSDPLFVNAAAGNYRLQGGSPALTAGRVVHSIGGTNGDTIPAGAYITGSETIGPNSALAAPGRPRWRPLSWWMYLLYAETLH